MTNQTDVGIVGFDYISMLVANAFTTTNSPSLDRTKDALAVMRDEEEVTRIATALWRIDIDYQVARDKFEKPLRAARLRHSEQLIALADSVRERRALSLRKIVGSLP